MAEVVAGGIYYMLAGAAIAVYAASQATSSIQTKAKTNVQTAKEGDPILIVWGISRPFAGTLVACQEPPKIKKKSSGGGGKGGGGGGGSSVEVPYRTYAVLMCEGPITGVRRVWRNSKLVYDARPGSEWGEKNNPTFLKRFKFYLGDYDQLPDPDLEAIFGIGNVPAMRGRAYMVARDEKLQDTAGAVPQWIFEVYRAQDIVYLNTPPYPVYGEDGVVLGGAAQAADLKPILIDGGSSMEAVSLGASCRQVELSTFGTVAVTVPTESVDFGASCRDVGVSSVLVGYNAGSEAVNMSGQVTGVSVKQVLIPYAATPESVNFSAAVIAVVLGAG